MPHRSLRGARALALVLVVALAGCKADRTSNGSVAFQQAPMRIGTLDTTLSLNGISFHVVGHERMLTIQPSGLKKDNSRVDTRLPGLVAARRSRISTAIRRPSYWYIRCRPTVRVACRSPRTRRTATRR